MDVERYQEIRNAVIRAGYAHEIEWAESVQAPAGPCELAGEAIWVILCSGMKEQVARKIHGPVRAALDRGDSAGSVFGHKGKAAAIDAIWSTRNYLFKTFQAAEDKVEWCATLPWIGPITKWHLAKSLGVDCAKPDVHLRRVAARYATTTAGLCGALATATGDRIATVDMVIWRACNLGIIDSRNLQTELAPS